VGTQAPETSLSVESRAALQRESLASVFTSNGEPPPPSESERARLASLPEQFPAEEITELEELVPDPELQLLAIRDSDGDGVHDYRVSDYYGKFMEGDVDVDGDGIRNALDSAPYDGAVGGVDDDGDGAPDRDYQDRDSDGIPDHVDWSGLAVGEAAGWQEQLFAEHGVLLAGRGAPFSSTFARSAKDAVTRIFRRRLEEGDLATLRLIATDETCLLSAEVDDATNAMVVPQTQTLMVYRVGLDYPPIAQLGLLAHELGHVWQFAWDFDAGDLAAENRRIHYPGTRFLALVEPFGWSSQPQPYDPAADDYTLFTPQYHTLGPTYLYQGESPAEWAARLERLYEEIGDSYLQDPTLAGVVGDYSLTNPWEWHADNLLAYLYASLEARARETLRREEGEETIAALRAIVQEAWPGFRYQNFDAERLEDHYRRYFPLSDSDLDYFVESYLRPVAADPSVGGPTG
jgi:hypothetical protein